VKIERHPINDGVIRLAVTGEIDMATADELYDAITAAVTGSHAAGVVVDLAGVTFCDSTGIGAIVRARNNGAAHGTSVQIINPCGLVYGALDLTGVLDALTRPTHRPT
jgi:anti-anti-sigma factor